MITLMIYLNRNNDNKWKRLSMNWNINDIPVFVAVSRLKSITAAATYLRMPKSSVSRALARLEEDLDVRLFDRNTRKMRLTTEGDAFLLHASAIMEQVDIAKEAVAGLRHEPRGTLNVSMPMAFSREVVGGRLLDFQTAYPDLSLQMLISSYQIDMLRENIDVAVSVGPITDSELIAQTLSDTKLIWVASRYYAKAHDWDDTLDCLRPHLKFCERRYQQPRFRLKTPRGWQTLDTESLPSITDPLILREMILRGGGVALLPELYCRHYINTGVLQQVCPGIETEMNATIYALTHSRRLQPQKARLFIDFLKECLSDYLKTGEKQS